MPTLAASEYGVTVSFSPPVGSTACATLQQLMKTGEAMSQTFGFEGGNAAPARVISSESAILQQLSPQGCLPYLASCKLSRLDWRNVCIGRKAKYSLK